MHLYMKKDVKKKKKKTQKLDSQPIISYLRQRRDSFKFTHKHLFCSISQISIIFIIITFEWSGRDISKNVFYLRVRVYTRFGCNDY
jgi:hypothetical protein